MTDNDMIPTKDILKARRRADYQRHKEAMREQRAQRKQAKDDERKQAKTKRTAQLQALLKPATELAEQEEQPTADP